MIYLMTKSTWPTTAMKPSSHKSLIFFLLYTLLELKCCHPQTFYGPDIRNRNMFTDQIKTPQGVLYVKQHPFSNQTHKKVKYPSHMSRFVWIPDRYISKRQITQGKDPPSLYYNSNHFITDGSPLQTKGFSSRMDHDYSIKYADLLSTQNQLNLGGSHNQCPSQKLLIPCKCLSRGVEIHIT